MSIMPAAYASMKKLVGSAPCSTKSPKATNSGRLSSSRIRASWTSGLGATPFAETTVLALADEACSLGSHGHGSCRSLAALDVRRRSRTTAGWIRRDEDATLGEQAFDVTEAHARDAPADRDGRP